MKKSFLSLILLTASIGLTSTAFAAQTCETIFTGAFGNEILPTAPIGSRENPMEMLPPGERVAVAPEKVAVTPPKAEGLLSKVFSFFKGSDVKREEVTFTKSSLSEVQFKGLKRTARNSGFSIEAGDKILVLTHDMLDSHFDSPVGTIEVQKNTAFEKALLRESNIDSDPREVLSIRIHTQDEIIETGILIVGERASVSAQATLAALGRYLDQNHFEDMTQIEIAHTHPVYAVTVERKDGSVKTALHELSGPDAIEASRIRSMIPSHSGVIIKAVVPNGFNYVGYIE